MNGYLPRLEEQFDELVGNILKLQDLSDQPAKFQKMDRELIQHLSTINEHYRLCKIKEELQNESSKLDEDIDKILLDLAYARQELIQVPEPKPESKRKFDSDSMLEYAARIAKFTKQMPGNLEQSILPWPVEDQLRRGMLATYTLQNEGNDPNGPPAGQDENNEADMSVDAPEPSKPLEQEASIPQPEPSQRPARKPSGPPPRRAPKQKISLDFDSDSD